jgi:hypothetical protein
MRSILKNDASYTHSTAPVLQLEWKTTLVAFLLAAGAGIFMRFALVSGDWYGLHFANVRHAHSHLMLFSWATSAWMILLARRFAAHGQDIKGMQICIRLSILIGSLTFIPFLFWGYTPARIGDVSVPVSIILSIAIIFVWYAFAAFYFRNRRLLVERLHLIDIAVIGMIVCTGGAWLRGVFVALKFADPVFADGAVHAFLTILTDGWLLLGLFGLVALRSGVAIPRRTVIAATIGLVLSFLVNLEAAPDAIRWIGAVSMFVFAVAALSALRALSGHISRFAYVALGAALLLRLLYVVPPIMYTIDGLQLRVTYLHWLYLPGISTLLLELSSVRGRRLRWFFASSVLLVIGTVPMSGLWPYLDSGALRPVGLTFMIASSFGPPLVLLSLLFSRVYKHRPIQQ